MQNNSKQDISQGALFINHSHTFETGWALNYGVHGGFTSSKTYIDYLYNKGNGYESLLMNLKITARKSIVEMPSWRCPRISVRISLQQLL